jgi:hypothetical protein
MPANAATADTPLARLRGAQPRLAARPRAEIVAAVAATAAEWTKEGSPWMARAVPAIAAEAGFSPEMVRRALPAMIAPLAGPVLGELAAQAEAAPRARRPRLTLQILPSNIPGHAAIASALALICRSATLLKPGRRDRVFTHLWVESLASVDADLAACVVAAYWAGAADAPLADFDLVVATGSDESVAAVQRRAPGRCILYGSRLSVAIVPAASLKTPAAMHSAARDIAVDVATWDQRGCLSPRLCFVEGGRDDAAAAAATIATALHELCAGLPPGPLSTEDALAVRRYRDAAEWAAEATNGLFFAADLAAGSVVVDHGSELRPGPSHRCLSVRAVASIGSLLDTLAPVRALLEGAGVAAGSHFPELAAQLAPLAIPLVCPAGQLQTPPLDWRHGGRSRIAPWIEAS